MRLCNGLFPALLALLSFFSLSQSAIQCSDYSYENKGSLASPTVADCEQLYWRIYRNHTFYVKDIQKQFGSYGKCKFGAQLDDDSIPHRFPPYQPFARMGADDARAMIRYSIDNYRWVGEDDVHRVGSKGRMLCANNTGNLWVEWGLY
ncbi:putative necrosis-inducing factor-domain-containing protein [Cladorrhinum sp. PSN332]|nr:putative necrosis-inducing factor-domain-containing protein [Cladorrhinum sp. PSN332]